MICRLFGKDSMFVSRVLAWYVEEVQTSLQSGDWTKPDEIVGMISTYQQAKNKIAGVTSGKMEAEIKYNRLDVFSQCKKGYLIFGGLLLVFAFASLFKRARWMRWASRALGVAVLAVFLFHTYGMGMLLVYCMDMLRGAIHMKQWSTLPGLRFLPVGCSRVVVC